MKTVNTIKRLPLYLCLGTIWLALTFIYNFLNDPDTFPFEFWNEIWRVFYFVAVNYIFFEYGLQWILKKRANFLFNIIIGILAITSLLLLVSLGLYFWKNLGIQCHMYTQLRHSILIPNGLYYQIIDEAFYEAWRGIASVFFFGVAKLLYHNAKLKQTAQQLLLEKKEAELNFLKSQTNPHFLFNTLNNIYALAKDKSDLAPESILRLSKILRFMLYETSGSFISIEQEVDIINDYIALEKLRYDDSLHIDFTHEIHDKKQSLPPLLLIPLVENAFKHGVSETSKEPFVSIRLLSDEKQLTFSIKNSTELHQGEKVVKENIGLSSLKRQLQLLYTDYQVSVQQDETTFTVTLKINLTSHV